MKEEQQQWVTPQLKVLIKGKQEESVLKGGCKDHGGSPGNSHNGCIGKGGGQSSEHSHHGGHECTSCTVPVFS